MTIVTMPIEIKEDLEGRMKAFQSGRLSRADVISNAQNTIQWLNDNDHEDEVPHYRKFLEGIG